MSLGKTCFFFVVELPLNPVSLTRNDCANKPILRLLDMRSHGLLEAGRTALCCIFKPFVVALFLYPVTLKPFSKPYPELCSSIGTLLPA